MRSIHKMPLMIHSMVRAGPAGVGFLRGKQRLEPLPLRVGEFFSFHTSECTPPSRVCKHALEGWLWDAACEIRGPLDAPKFKDYILPLVFLKRLSDVFDDEVARLAMSSGTGRPPQNWSSRTTNSSASTSRKAARWPAIASQTTGLGEHLTDAVRAVAAENPRLRASST